MSPQVTALVPIKKNSQRLPRKNFRDFNGRPLYHWILDTLESVPEIDRIVVNTDAEGVIETAPELFDVEISERPEWLQELNTTRKIIEYEVRRLDADVFLHTYCTNPLLTAETISEAIQEFIASDEHDSLLPVTAHYKWFYDSEFEPINHDPHELDRTQDLTPLYEDNSALYMYTEKTIEKTGHRIGENPLAFEVDEIEATDIDVRSDFELAECLHKQRDTEE
jgi:CMP-N-acetylneuraminic acid synthetase